MGAPATRTAPHNGTTHRVGGPAAPSIRQAAAPTVPARSRRNTGRIALGVLVLVMSALGAVVLFSSAADRVAVIGIARDVPAGKAINESDLREVSISGGDGLRTIPADDASKVIGRTATVGLVEGSLLSPGQLTDGRSLPDGTVVAGAVLKGGQYPVGLAIGDSVDVIETTSPDASGAGEPASRGTAKVIDLSESADGQSLLTVSLAVPSDSATAISSAGASGRLSLVVTAP